MVQAYQAWHREGDVHSVETWWDGELVGGLYAVQIDLFEWFVHGRLQPQPKTGRTAQGRTRAREGIFS